MKISKAEERKIQELKEQLTLDEKIGMIHGSGLFCTKGVERLGIPPLVMSDGPMGVRCDFENSQWRAVGNSDDYVTYLPCGSALAASWNPDLAYEAGKVLGEEARGRGKDVILAPGINIKRSPLCGRNFEYMSEDPWLTGEIAAAFVRGIQTADTAACVKHYAVNNQETQRLWVDAKVGQRALREIYLPAFEKVIKKGEPYSLMGAYNRYLGTHCCENTVLLDQILRDEWGYDGTVISDWGAVHCTKAAAESSLDIEMSVTDNFNEYCLADPLKKAVEQGEIEEGLIDRKVEHILRLMFRIHKMTAEGEDISVRNPGAYNTPAHRETVLEAARESAVLLKNDSDLLPLDPRKESRILVIGDNADRLHSNGGGSAEIKALYEISPLMGIKKLLGGNAEVTFVRGYCADDMEESTAQINWQADSLKNVKDVKTDEADDCKNAKPAALAEKQSALRQEALKLAREYDTVIFIGGLNHNQDTEGHDRENMKLPYGQDRLIEELLQEKPDTVVVLIGGSPVEMPWIAEAKTLVWQWYAGMEGGTALAEVLFGRVNPSGKLPESFPVSHTDCPAHCIGEFPGCKEPEELSVSYSEEIYVGYRYYDTFGEKVQFPFGYGLSYTKFTLSSLSVQEKDHAVRVSAKVRNAGKRKGKTVVQLYIGKKDSVKARAAKELKGFVKLELDPGETKTAEFLLEKDAFVYYEEEKEQFETEKGEYEIYIGTSVRDICLTGSCRIG